jgi:signal transduction histidine kinase
MTNERTYVMHQKALLSRKIIRILVFIGLIPAIGLTALDYYVYNDLFVRFFVIRITAGLAIVITFVLYELLCKISDIKHYLTYAEIMIILTGIYTSSMIAIMVYYTGGVESAYFSGFFVVAAFMVVFYYFRFLSSLITGSIILGIYCIPILFYKNIGNNQQNVSNIVLLASALLITIGWAHIFRIINDKRLSLEYSINKHKEDLEEVIQSRTAQLLQSQKMESLGVFAAGLAHDFNNILSSIKSFTDYMLFNDDTSESDRNNYQIIDTELKKGSRIVDRLMSMGKSSSIEKTDIDINELISDMMEVITKALSSGINIKYTLANDIPPIRADKTLIQQAINNLIINARNAMGDKGEIYVETRVVDKESDNIIERTGLEDRYVRITVDDNGPGIPNDLLGKVFDPFVTSKEQGIGTGLGLSMVYIIAHDHSGFVDVESTEGIGTTFNMYLPY